MSGGAEPPGGWASSWLGPVLATVGVIFAAGLGALGHWAASRLVGKAAFQNAINEGFKGLLDRMAATQQAEREAWHAERLQLAGKIAQLQGDMINMTQAHESLKSHLSRRGIQIPRSYRPGTIEDVIMIEGTARALDDES